MLAVFADLISRYDAGQNDAYRVPRHERATVSRQV